MPRNNGVYSNPGWVNGTTPAINATEMNAISDTLAKVGVQNGGTGRTEFKPNAVLLGNETSTLQNVRTKHGAFYALGTDDLPQFDVLPMSCGGTGSTGLITTGNLGQHSSFIQSGYLTKFGKLVVLEITTQSTSGSFETGSYIPSGYRPQRNLWFTFTGSNSGNTRAVMSAYIDSDGCIHALSQFSNNSGTNTFHATVAYFTNQ